MCHTVRLSGGQVGFHQMQYHDAVKAAKALGAVKEVNTYVAQRGYSYMTGRFSTRHELYAVAFLNDNDMEVFNWILPMQSGQVFDPPRMVSQALTHDHTL